MSYLTCLRSLLVTGLWMPMLLQAQTTIQVVTKTIQKEWVYQTGALLIITGDKADITIEGWAKNTVQLKLKLVAKHPERTVAANEVNYLHYVIDQSAAGTEIANRIVIPQTARQVRSNLKAIYELRVPFNCVIRLQNKYGSSQVSHLQNALQAKLEFCNLALSYVQGRVDIESEYSDIAGNFINGNFSCRANKATIQLHNLNGTNRIESNFGRIEVTPGLHLKSLLIDASRTAVVFKPAVVGHYQYNLSTRFSEIHLPNNISLQYRKNVLGKQTFVFSPKATLPSVGIVTSYSPITIQSK